MIRLLVFIVFIAGSWSAAWYVLREVLQHQLAEFSTISDPQNHTQTPSLSYTDQAITGYPTRLNWQMETPRITFQTPASQMAPAADGTGALPLLLSNPVFWQASRVALDTGLRWPLQLDAHIQGPHLMGIMGQEITAEGPDWTGSVTLQPQTDLGLSELVLDIPQASLSSTWGWNTQIDALRLTLIPPDSPEQEDGSAVRYQLLASLDTLWVDDVAQGWPEAVSAREMHLRDLQIEADLGLTAALDRHLLTQGMPGQGLLDIIVQKFEADLDGMLVSAEGDIRFDQTGLASGELQVQIDEWTIMPAIAYDLGIIDADDTMFFMGLLANMAQSSSPPDQLQLILRLTQGRVQLGPLELGTLPALPVAPTLR